MKRHLYSLALPGLLLGFSGLVKAQEFVKKKVTNENGSLSLVIFKDNSGLTSASVPDLFKNVLNLKSTEQLRLIKSDLDFTSQFLDEKYQQYYNDLKVEGGIYNLHYLKGALKSMNGEVFYGESTPLKPSISAASAFYAALKNVGAQKYMWEDLEYTATNEYKKPPGELLYIPIAGEDGKYNLILAYKFDIYAAFPLSRANIYVDAVTGRIAATDAIIKHAKNGAHPELIPPITVEPYKKTSPNFITLIPANADTRYSGSQSIETSLATNGKYILFDTTRGNGVRTYNLKKNQTLSTGVNFEDVDNNWTAAEYNNAAFDNAALDAHWGVQKTYDYFKSTFNQDSYDGSGSILKAYVHYGDQIDNAFWTGSEMLYGDGMNSFSPLTSLDVTAHELGHGVCSSTANLIYSRESGALNEAFSDIWAAAAEYKYAPTKQTWLIGEEITKIAPYYLRSLIDPKSGLFPQPDTYRGVNWYPSTIEDGCVYPNNSNDNCGVHYNSGVLNHWFYILSVGKTGINDNGSNYSVQGITIEKAEKIAYRLLTNYLTFYSDYKNARDFGIQAAKDLYGDESPEAIATQDAFYAVGVGLRYLSTPDIISPTVPTNLAASNTTGSQTTLTWTAATDDNGIDRYLIYKDGTELATVAGSKTTYTVTGLARTTEYSFYVKAVDPYDNISAQSNTLQVNTTNQLMYCTSTSTNTADERIKRVQFGTIDNASTTTGGYEDFSAISSDVKRESSYTITITPEWRATNYAEGYGVFIDWNNDGDFNDAGEIAFTKAASNTSPIVGNIIIPATAELASVRMRVSLKYNAVPTSCETFTYGQVEDYTLNIKEKTLAVSTLEAKSTLLYPNPVKDIVNIQSKMKSEFSYKIYNTAGQIAGKGNSADKKINVSSLTPGNYIIELTDKDGQTITQKLIKK